MQSVLSFHASLVKNKRVEASLYVTKEPELLVSACRSVTVHIVLLTSFQMSNVSVCISHINLVSTTDLTLCTDLYV